MQAAVDGSEVMLKVTEPGGTRSVVLVDDGRVAYAYLLESDRIVADVWLYNVGKDPAAVDWKDETAMPFCNPASYCTEEVLPRLRSESRVGCEWSTGGAVVSVEGLVWARLEVGSSPGWSRKARLPGPLAGPLR